MSIPFGPILVVEDIPSVLEMLAATLRFKGYPVITARDGLEALELIEKQRPALVITDIFMPRLDGFNLARSLQKNPFTNRIPILFTSATYTTPGDKDFALSLGAVRFMEKPIDTEDFLLTVAEILTQGVSSLSQPLGEEEFYQGYRQRLENKLRYKNTQIARTERLLETLAEDQRPAFEALLAEAIHERNQIQAELDELYRILNEMKKD